MTVEMIERLAKLIVQLGLSTVVAMVLLWFVLTRFDAALTRVSNELEAQTQRLGDIQDHIVHRDQQLFKYEWRQQYRPPRERGD